MPLETPRGSAPGRAGLPAFLHYWRWNLTRWNVVAALDDDGRPGWQLSENGTPAGQVYAQRQTADLALRLFVQRRRETLETPPTAATTAHLFI